MARLEPPRDSSEHVASGAVTAGMCVVARFIVGLYEQERTGD